MGLRGIGFGQWGAKQTLVTQQKLLEGSEAYVGGLLWEIQEVLAGKWQLLGLR